MTDLREAVARAIFETNHDYETMYIDEENQRQAYLREADAAITTVLTILAVEASPLEIVIRSPDGDWSDVGSWILFHLPSPPEVTDGEQ